MGEKDLVDSHSASGQARIEKHVEASHSNERRRRRVSKGEGWEVQIHTFPLLVSRRLPLLQVAQACFEKPAKKERRKCKTLF